METPLVYQPRTAMIYSDINYMLLAYIIEKVTGMGLEDYVADNFYRPLGLNRICFTPLRHGFTLDEIAATEIRAKPRSQDAIEAAQATELVHGTVHDTEAYCSDGRNQRTCGLVCQCRKCCRTCTSHAE